MTPQEQLALIKQKVIEAVPSILDLKFGCQYIGVGRNNDGEWEHWQDVVTFEIPKKEIIEEIIGRPIILPDVLLAIRSGYAVTALGDFIEVHNGGEWEFPGTTTIYKWNLLLPLDGQESETIAFLAELLK